MSTVFVTVGSTGFDSLVEACTTISFLNALEQLGYKQLTIQYGSSEPIYTRNMSNNNIENENKNNDKILKVEGYAYKPSITEDMENASLIISHAGNKNNSDEFFLSFFPFGYFAKTIIVL